jgi:formiminotetrahydrofolate cyclodeaminase
MDLFLQELARPQPDPGGGAAAAYGANLGLALLEKVVRLEGRRRPRPQGQSGLGWEAALARLQRLAQALARLREEDVRAYVNLTAARASGDTAQLAAAVAEAVDCPGRIAQQSLEALELLAWAGERCQRHLLSDLSVAGEFLGAALRGAAHIAAANLPLVREEGKRRALAAELDQSRREGEDLYRRVQAGLLDRWRLPGRRAGK